MSGSQPGSPKPKIQERLTQLGISDFKFEGFPVTFWDVLGEQGHPVRATISDMGPVLLARLLELNDTQGGALQIAFKLADDRQLLLVDLKDLKALLAHLAANAADVSAQYGNVTPASVGAIQRALLTLETQGGDRFFGEAMLDIADLMRRDGRGRGIVSVLAADRLMLRPRLYATFLLWLLAELFENLPEIGDVDRPKLVFFFDEAHLLFADAPGILKGPDEDRSWVCIKIIRTGSEPGPWTSYRLEAMDPFSQDKEWVTPREILGKENAIKERRSSFRDKTGRRIYLYPGQGAEEKPTTVIFYQGVPDTTPEFLTEKEMEDYFGRAMMRIKKP